MSKVHQQQFKILKQLYPIAKSELNFKDNYQLIVAVSLSAQCTDKKVNQVTEKLFSSYPDFSTLASAPITRIEKIIKEVNYYKTKSKNIKAMATRVCEEFSKELPLNFTDLESLPGVGHKTASVILSENNIPALAVDTHVFRVSKRLGMAHGKNVVTVEQELKNLFPKSDWQDLHHRLIFHGRRVCKAQNPACSECLLISLCPKNDIQSF